MPHPMSTADPLIYSGSLLSLLSGPASSFLSQPLHTPLKLAPFSCKRAQLSSLKKKKKKISYLLCFISQARIFSHVYCGETEALCTSSHALLLAGFCFDHCDQIALWEVIDSRTPHAAASLPLSPSSQLFLHWFTVVFHSWLSSYFLKLR